MYKIKLKNITKLVLACITLLRASHFSHKVLQKKKNDLVTLGLNK